jgi:ribosome-associated protein
MNIDLLRESIKKHSTETFSRSGGPGGQNVNKVNTKVLLSIDLNLLEGLTDQERTTIFKNLSSRIKDSSVISLFVDEERFQIKNREIAVNKLISQLIQAAHQDKKRISTKPGKAAKLRRLQKKQTHSITKNLRKKPDYND